MAVQETRVHRQVRPPCLRHTCDNSHAVERQPERRSWEPHPNSMELDMASATTLDPKLTINEIVAQFPATIPVFDRFGLDTCCGGGVRVDEAAQRDGIDAAELLSALRQTLERR